MHSQGPGKNTGVPSSWEVCNHTNYGLTCTSEITRRTSFIREVSRTSALAHNALELYPTTSSQPLYFSPTKPGSVHRT